MQVQEFEILPVGMGCEILPVVAQEFEILPVVAQEFEILPVGTGVLNLTHWHKSLKSYLQAQEFVIVSV